MHENKNRILINMLVFFTISYSPFIIGLFLFFLVPSLKNTNSGLFEVLSYITILLIFVCLFYVAKHKDETTDFDRSWLRMTLSEWAYFILLILSVLIISPFVVFIMTKIGLPRNEISEKYCNWWYVLFFVFTGSFISPITEELFWRGYIQWNLRKIYGPKISLIGQAVAFSLLHIGGAIHVAFAFTIGIIFGLWREKRRTLIPIIMVHIIVNTLYYLRAWQALLFPK